jgi:hypothetical protein
MTSFHKYNLTDGYETFLYYDEVRVNCGKTRYVQYMYAGFNDGEEPDMSNETFYTNLVSRDKSYEALWVKFEAYGENVDAAIIKGFTPPAYIVESLRQHFRKL